MTLILLLGVEPAATDLEGKRQRSRAGYCALRSNESAFQLDFLAKNAVAFFDVTLRPQILVLTPKLLKLDLHSRERLGDYGRRRRGRVTLALPSA